MSPAHVKEGRAFFGDQSSATLFGRSTNECVCPEKLLQVAHLGDLTLGNLTLGKKFQLEDRLVDIRIATGPVRFQNNSENGLVGLENRCDGSFRKVHPDHPSLATPRRNRHPVLHNLCI